MRRHLVVPRLEPEVSLSAERHGGPTDPMLRSDFQRCGYSLIAHLGWFGDACLPRSVSAMMRGAGGTKRRLSHSQSKAKAFIVSGKGLGAAAG